MRFKSSSFKTNNICRNNKVRMCYGSGTFPHAYSEPMTSHAAGYRLFAKWRHGRHLEMTSYPKSDSLSIDAYSLGKQSCQISSRSDLKRRSLRLFWKKKHKNKLNERYVISKPRPTWSTYNTLISQSDKYVPRRQTVHDLEKQTTIGPTLQ